ncbi:hypothetical protein S751_21065 [Salmonella enterica subsp. arizonae]|nr:hypothetical protein [Salmonella enterica subsp. arizonae]
MPNISNTHLTQTHYPLAVVEAKTDHGDERFVIDKNKGIVYQFSIVTNNTMKLNQVDLSTLKKAMGIKSIDKVTHCDAIEIMKNPSMINTILSPYSSSSSSPGRFKAITDLGGVEKSQYKQLSESDKTAQLRQALLSLVDDDLKEPFSSLLNEWGTYGVSACEVDKGAYSNFKQFYDEEMASHAVKKDDYAKLDFSTQNIKSHITDPRCINAKLTPLQLFKAAFQLGDTPAVSNFRFMNNPATKDDGKYREWMYHFDNSNYAAEFKLITTRTAGTEQANNEQCLAAFPYDTEKTIRFTQSEAATKFPTMDDLQKEFSHIPGASYVVIRNPDNTTPIETGIRTEMIVHHRSASGKNETESRDAELMTFHGVDRCQPFLTPQELEQALHLTSLQRFVLGEFRDAEPQQFLEALKEQKETLNAQIRQSLTGNALKPLEKITVAKFSEQGLQITDEELFNKQISTYDNLPEVLDKLPKLELSSADLTEDVLTIVPMLMNYDQNAELKPDCSENKAFPARTQLRERTNEQFREPLERDLQHVKMSHSPNNLLSMDKLIDITHDIQDFYQKGVHSLKALKADPKLIALYESRAELAREYASQFPTRATHPETHQVLSLFTYYMVDDLDQAAATLHNLGANVDSTHLAHMKDQQQPLLQHFITHRLLNDQLAD